MPCNYEDEDGICEIAKIDCSNVVLCTPETVYIDKKDEKLSLIQKICYKTEVGSSILCDLDNFDCDITPERILEELEHNLYLINQDGWENYLDNPQQIRSLKTLIRKVKNIINKN